MRNENDVQDMADKASSAVSNNPHVEGTVESEGSVYDVEYLRGVVDALDWVLDEDMESGPVS